MGKVTKDNVGKKSISKTPILLFFALIIIVGLFVGNYIRGNKRKKLVYAQIKKTNIQLKETKPILSSTMFSGRIAYAYQLASEIPEIIDKQFCYCYCRKNHGHKTLLTCFTEEHGSKCDICMNEVFMANDLLKKGYGIDEITDQIDKYFEKIAKKNSGHSLF